MLDVDIRNASVKSTRDVSGRLEDRRMDNGVARRYA